MTRQLITDKSNLKKYFMQLPNLYDDAGLDPFEFRLLAHYVRRGDCWEALRTSAAACHMSKNIVTAKRNSLARKGFIRLGKRTPLGTIHILIVDRWAENFARYSPTKGTRRVPKLGQASARWDNASHHVGTKNNQEEEPRRKNQGRRAPPSGALREKQNVRQLSFMERLEADLANPALPEPVRQRALLIKEKRRKNDREAT